MEDTLITLETAILAKASGFNIKTDKGYCGINTGTDYKTLLLWLEGEEVEPDLGYAPTQSLLQKWLREKHSIYIEPNWNSNLTNKHQIQIHTIDSFCIYDSELEYNTYEDALEIGLQEALKQIK